MRFRFEPSINALCARIGVGEIELARKAGVTPIRLLNGENVFGSLEAKTILETAELKGISPGLIVLNGNQQYEPHRCYERKYQ